MNRFFALACAALLAAVSVSSAQTKVPARQISVDASAFATMPANLATAQEVLAWLDGNWPAVDSSVWTNIVPAEADSIPSALAWIDGNWMLVATNGWTNMSPAGLTAQAAFAWIDANWPRGTELSTNDWLLLAPSNATAQAAFDETDRLFDGAYDGLDEIWDSPGMQPARIVVVPPNELGDYHVRASNGPSQKIVLTNSACYVVFDPPSVYSAAGLTIWVDKTDADDPTWDRTAIVEGQTAFSNRTGSFVFGYIGDPGAGKWLEVWAREPTGLAAPTGAVTIATTGGVLSHVTNIVGTTTSIYAVYSYTNTSGGLFDLRAGAPLSVGVSIVGGGGGGGMGAASTGGGGGGAGGRLVQDSYLLEHTGTYSIVVGAGGAGDAASAAPFAGASGGDSSFNGDLVGLGGGGGAGSGTNTPAGGGCGGGARNTGNSYEGSATGGTGSQGGNGGSCGAKLQSAAGGGRWDAAGNAPAGGQMAGAGGAGALHAKVPGLVLGGGGGAGMCTEHTGLGVAYNGGIGGAGGGGDGGTYSGSAWVAAEAGQAGTGGGGGGGRRSDPGGAGAAGGSGRVDIWYRIQ